MTLSRRTLVAGTAWGVPTVMVVGAAPAMAASPTSHTLPRTAGTVNGWNGTPVLLASEDGSNATTTGATLTLSNFGFSIPTGATLNSVTINIRYSWLPGGNSTGTLTMRAYSDVVSAANERSNLFSTSTFQTSNLSGTQVCRLAPATGGFTIAELNSTTTRVVITTAKSTGSPEFRVDYVNLTVVATY